MTTYTKINIPNISLIQSQLAEWAIGLFKNTTKSGYRECTEQELRHYIPELFEFFNEHNLIWQQGRFFYTEPNFITPIHIDGDAAYPRLFAINLPVEGCKNTSMCWYNNVDLITDQSSDYSKFAIELSKNKNLRIFDSPNKKIIASTDLSFPILSRVDIPHNIINNTNYRRITLSNRFYDEENALTTLWNNLVS